MDADLPFRCEVRTAVMIAGLIFIPLLVLTPIVPVLCWFPKNPKWDDAWVAAFLFSSSGFMAYLLMRGFQWVELDGTQIRARHFWTRRLLEKTVADIVEIKGWGEVHPTLANLIMEKLFGPNRRFEIRFRRGPRILLSTHDMANVLEFMEALEAAIEEHYARLWYADEGAELDS